MVQSASGKADLPALDLLKLSASELHLTMHNGELTSQQLVGKCLKQNQRYNQAAPMLHAIISTPSTDALEREAKVLDKERAEGKLRGPLHGIPIIVKVFTYG